MTTHTLAPSDTTVAAALVAAGMTAFDFDLPVKLSLLTNVELRNAVMSRVAFACDAYINITIQRSLSALREAEELSGAARWDSYQAFLGYVSGIAASEETMAEAGMEVEPMRDTVQKLFNLRTQLHSLLHTFVGEKYETPVITDWMRNPRVRRDDADTLRKLKSTIKMAATDMETGAIDVELEKQLIESYAAKRMATKEDQLKWDKQRGELAATMFDALKIRDDIADIGFAGDNEEPFLDLSAEHQFKLLEGTKRHIGNVLMAMIDDRKVTPEMHAAAAIESRPLMKEVIGAMGHSRFAKLRNA